MSLLEHDPDLTALGELVGVREELAAIRRTLSRADEWGAIDSVQRLVWTAGSFQDFSGRGKFRSVVVVNENAFAITVGLAPGAGARAGQPETFTLPANGWILIPARDVTISVGAAQAGAATVVPLAVAMPFAMGTTAGISGALDISDRLGRALGRVSVGIGDSNTASAVVTAPAAGANICTLAAGNIPAGVYIVRSLVQIGGAAPAAADIGNTRLRNGGAGVIEPHPTSGEEVTIDRFTSGGAQPLSLAAVGAATAGVVYYGRITATRIE